VLKSGGHLQFTEIANGKGGACVCSCQH
jgi:hypothetical protein